MSEIIFGTPEHIAGLSREALEADFRYVQDRRTELEEVCERLQAENEKLRELVRRLYNMADFCRNCPDTERCDVDVEWLGCTVADPINKLMDELGVEV